MKNIFYPKIQKYKNDSLELNYNKIVDLNYFNQFDEKHV